MKYCMRCGVQVDEEIHDFCPLCDTIILTDSELSLLTKEGLKEKQRTVFATFQEEGKKLLVNQLGRTAIILFFVLLITMIALFIIDYAMNQTISWSLLPIISIAVFDSVLNLILLHQERTFKYTASIVLMLLMGYFFSLNYILSSTVTWSYYIILSLALIFMALQIFYLKQTRFLFRALLFVGATILYSALLFMGPYGNPVGTIGNPNYFTLSLNALVFLVGGMAYIFIKTYIYNKYLIVAIVSIAFSVLIKGVEWLINYFMIEEGDLNFSFYVLIILLPVAGLMFILNNKQRVIDYIKKKYHI